MRLIYKKNETENIAWGKLEGMDWGMRYAVGVLGMMVRIRELYLY